MDPLQPGDPKQVGKYRLVGRLGEGGQGVVYLGERRPGEKVAVKVRPLPKGGADHRFRKEREAAGAVPPQYTARLLDSGEDEKYLYLVTEYIDGPSLKDKMEGPEGHNWNNPQKLPPAEWRKVAAGTILALAEFHRLGVVHRDFKPANVLCGRGRPRVIDFGISRYPEGTETLGGGRVGTLIYMSPEQYENREIGPPSDVFSWAVTMAYAATGQHPFKGRSDWYKTGAPDLDVFEESWRPLFARCLSLDPAERPTAVGILHHLSPGRLPGWALQEDSGPTVDPPETLAPSVRKVDPFPRRLLWAGAGLLAGIMVVTVPWWMGEQVRAGLGGCPQPTELRVMVPPEDMARFQHEYAPAFEEEKSEGKCRQVHLTVFAQPSLEALRAAFEGGWADRLSVDPQPDVWLPSSSAEKDYVDPEHRKTDPPAGFHKPTLSVLGHTEGSLLVAAATPLAKERLKGWDSGLRRGWLGFLRQAEAAGVEVVRPNPDVAASGTLGSAGLYTDPEVLDPEGDGKPKVDLLPFERHMTKESPQDARDALCTANLKGRAAVVIVSERTMNEYNDAPDKGCGEGRDQGLDKLSALYPERVYRLDQPFVRVSWPEDRERKRDSYARDLHEWMAGKLPETEKWLAGSLPLEEESLEATQRLLKEAGGGRTVEFLFDLTSSMEWATGGTPRLRIAQDLTNSIVPELWGKDRIGLWGFPGARNSKPELHTPRLPGAKDQAEHLGTDPDAKETFGDGVDGLRADRDRAPLYEAIAVRAEALDDSTGPPGVLVVFTDEAGVDSKFSSTDLRSKLVSLKSARVVVVVLSGKACTGELTLLAGAVPNLKCLAFGDELRSKVLTEIRRIPDE